MAGVELCEERARRAPSANAIWGLASLVTPHCSTPEIALQCVFIFSAKTQRTLRLCVSQPHDQFANSSMRGAAQQELRPPWSPPSRFTHFPNANTLPFCKLTTTRCCWSMAIPQETG